MVLGGCKMLPKWATQWGHVSEYAKLKQVIRQGFKVKREKMEAR